MARTKNVGGGPGDKDPRPPPRQPIDPKGKATKKLAVRKCKYPDADTARAAIVAEATEHAERGGAHSGVRIADPLSLEAMASLQRVEHLHGGPARTLMIRGRRVAIDEVQPQGEPQQQPYHTQQTQEPQPAQQTQEPQPAQQSQEGEQV